MGKLSEKSWDAFEIQCLLSKEEEKRTWRHLFKAVFPLYLLEK